MPNILKTRNLFQLFGFFIAASGALAAIQTQAFGSRLAEKDLAVAFPLESPNLISVSAPDSSPKLFPMAWYAKILQAFSTSSVGNALETENEFADWKLVSARLVPCSPLGVTTAQNTDLWCWPEIRLVWQPVLNHFSQMGRVLPAYADDRAVHALYDISPQSVGLSAAEAQAANALKQKVRNQLSVGSSGPSPLLNINEQAQFLELRSKVLKKYLSDILALRSPNISDAEFSGLGVRPETNSSEESRLFKNRFTSFVLKYADSKNIRALTAFSLPEGRQAPLLDEWVFLSFQGINGNLVPEDILLKSNVDGRTLFNYGKTPRASQRRDDDKIYEFLDRGSDNKAKQEIENSVLLQSTDRARLGTAISDRGTLLVPNTSCGSCHKLNQDLFDFHNFSYFENRGLTPAPRVRRDVELDLNWLAKFNR